MNETNSRRKQRTSRRRPARRSLLNLPSSAGVTARWRPYYRALVRLRERLLQDRAGHLRKLAEPLECRGRDIAKSAGDESSQDFALTEISAEQNALQEVEEAIRRIRDGSYGTCQLTHLPIERERLRAVPWTRFSKTAAEQLERQRSGGTAESQTEAKR